MPLDELSLQRLISNSFATLIEASIHDTNIWDALKQNSQMQDLVFNLLLAEPRHGIRQEVAEIVFCLCGSSPMQKQYPKGARESNNPPTTTAIDIIATVWA